MFIRSFLFRHGPTPGKLLDRFNNIGPVPAYARWWSATQLKLARWHRSQLRALDPSGFGFSESIDRLMDARIQARAQGMQSDDPRYPCLSDFTT
jgi:hypothetical protein